MGFYYSWLKTKTSDYFLFPKKLTTVIASLFFACYLRKKRKKIKQMEKIQNILIPTDFSENARNAMNYALAFFKTQKIKLTFLHVYHVPVITPEMPADIIYQSIEESKKASKEGLSSLCKELTEIHSNIQCDYLIKQEPLSDACNEALKEKKIDLIVMGTHGASGLKKLLFGSNAASVISSSSCPVLAVPENAKCGKMKTMLFATDYHDSDVEDIASLAEIAKQFDSEIIIVHVSEGKESDSAMLHWFEGIVKKKTDFTKISFFLLGKSDLVPSLDSFVQNNDVDLVAMSTRKRSPFEKLFSASQTKRMVYHTHIPLLAFHSRDVEDDNF